MTTVWKFYPEVKPNECREYLVWHSEWGAMVVNWNGMEWEGDDAIVSRIVAFYAFTEPNFGLEAMFFGKPERHPGRLPQ